MGSPVEQPLARETRHAAEEFEEQLRRDLWRQIKLGEKRSTWADAVERCTLEDAHRERRDQLHALGVGQLFLYGSVARNEAREDNDVDLLVEQGFRSSILCVYVDPCP